MLESSETADEAYTFGMAKTLITHEGTELGRKDIHHVISYHCSRHRDPLFDLRMLDYSMEKGKDINEYTPPWS